MTDPSAEPVSRYQPADAWGTRRIWIAGALGAVLAIGSRRILDFWPLGAAGSLSLGLRGLFELSQMFFILPLAGFVVGLLIAAAVALWRRHFRRAEQHFRNRRYPNLLHGRCRGAAIRSLAMVRNCQ